jgi:chorismate mutase/prephenate dehydrogenase
MSTDRLAALRAELSELDAQLLHIAARRTQISLQIGRVKGDLGRGTRDFTREKVVLDRASAQGQALGLPDGLAERLQLQLIEASLSVQEQDRIAQDGSGDGKRALVIGGSGRMGRWFVTFLAAQGYDVTVADPAPGPDGPSWVADWTTLEVSHDLVVVATPLAATCEVLQALAVVQPPGVVFDISSLKTPLQEGHQALLEAGVRVTSLHPMFGPDTSLLSGRHVLLVDVGSAEATRCVRDLFSATMAEHTELSWQKHDALIAEVLGLSHALNLAFSAALANSGTPLALLRRVSSTTFDAQLDVATRVMQENPRLYFDIQAYNPYGREVLERLQRAIQHIAALAEHRDAVGFAREMDDGRAFLM